MTVDNTTTIDQEERKQTRKTIKICTFCGEKVPRTGTTAKPAMSSVIFVAKKDILEKFVSPLTPRRKKYPVAHENFTKDQNEYPSTMVTIRINRQKHTIKVD